MRVNYRPVSWMALWPAAHLVPCARARESETIRNVLIVIGSNNDETDQFKTASKPTLSE